MIAGMEAVNACRFIVDANAGRLARWLRVMGYDALYEPDIEDAEMVRVAEAEGRAIVTRDRLVMRRRAIASGRVSALLLNGERLEDQLRQVVEAYGLDASGGFSRCIECNAPLRAVERETARSRAPAYVFETQEAFMECPCCARLYWRGTHWRNMLSELAVVGADRS